MESRLLLAERHRNERLHKAKRFLPASITHDDSLREQFSYMGAIYRARSTRSRAESSFTAYKSPLIARNLYACQMKVPATEFTMGYNFNTGGPLIRGNRYLE